VFQYCTDRRLTMKVRKIYFDKAADVPNSKLPVLLYRGVLPSHTANKAKTFRERFKGAGFLEPSQSTSGGLVRDFKGPKMKNQESTARV
jgi:hypothetical protein